METMQVYRAAARARSGGAGRGGANGVSTLHCAAKLTRASLKTLPRVCRVNMWRLCTHAYYVVNSVHELCYAHIDTV